MIGHISYKSIRPYLLKFTVYLGGQGGIRTHETRQGTPHFECGAINHSTTCPSEGSDTEARRRWQAQPSGRASLQPFSPASQRTWLLAVGDKSGAATPRASVISSANPKGGLTMMRPAAVRRSFALPSSAASSIETRTTLFAPAASTSPAKACAS